MHIDEFYQSRKPDWESLGKLLARGRGGLGGYSPKDVETLGRLYRAAAADLALAQRDFPTHALTRYLNQLVAQAHAAIYRSEPMVWRRFWRFFSGGFPRLYRQTFPFTLAAMLFFTLPALASGLTIGFMPQAARWLLPVSAQDLIPMIEQQELWTDISPEESPAASSFIMQNNIQVSFLAFGSGVSGGVLTAFVLINNGLLLGGITGLTAHYGVGWRLWAFVIGHGVLELSVIFIAGGAGLMLGWALLHPGLMRRRDALLIASQKAVKLLLGAIPWLVVAGTIEGFISPAEAIPTPVKWLVGLGSGVLFYTYLLRGGKKRETSNV